MFTGRVKIIIKAKKTIDHLVVHSRNLTISETGLYFLGGADVPISSVFDNQANDYWVMKFPRRVSKGIYLLNMKFNGSLTNGLNGMYKSVYENADGKAIPIVASQFEPTEARKAFPCFDEPSFKATFTITLVRPSLGYIALSNMPVVEDVKDSPSEGMMMIDRNKTFH